MAASPHELQNYIGYPFRDPEILTEALTRRAYQNENPNQKKFMNALAILGDAVLSTIAVQKFYDEGKRDQKTLTEEKVLAVNRKNTRKFAKDHNLGHYIHWGKGEEKDETCKDSPRALDTVTEALIGAVYLDAEKNKKNGITAVRDMLERLNFFNKDS